MEKKKRVKAWKTAQNPDIAQKNARGVSSANPPQAAGLQKSNAVTNLARGTTASQQTKRTHDHVESTSRTIDDQHAKKLKIEAFHVQVQKADTSDTSGTARSGQEFDKSSSCSILDQLSAIYEVSSMNIISSAKVESKVTRILAILSSFSFLPTSKPTIVFLHAKAPTASKMITIVEIAKRNLSVKGLKWYQYNGLDQNLEERKREKPVTILGKTVGIDVDEDADMAVDDGTSFETLMSPLERAIDGRPKIRAVPIMAIYLSRIPVESLRVAYGEQTNATDIQE